MFMLIIRKQSRNIRTFGIFCLCTLFFYTPIAYFHFRAVFDSCSALVVVRCCRSRQTRGDCAWILWKVSGKHRSVKIVSRTPSMMTYARRRFSRWCWNMLNTSITPCQVVSVPITWRSSSANNRTETTSATATSARGLRRMDACDTAEMKRQLEIFGSFLALFLCFNNKWFL